MTLTNPTEAECQSTRIRKAAENGQVDEDNVDSWTIPIDAEQVQQGSSPGDEQE